MGWREWEEGKEREGKGGVIKIQKEGYGEKQIMLGVNSLTFFLRKFIW